MSEIDVELNDPADTNITNISSHKNYIKLIQLNSNSKRTYLENTLRRFQTMREKHMLSYEHYNRLNNALVIPSIMISGIISFVSFIGDSFNDLLVEGGSSQVLFTIGCVTSVNTLLSTLTNTLHFKSKSEAHQQCAKAYSRLSTEIRTELLSMQDEQFLTYLEEQELQIKSNMNYLIPSSIENKFKSDDF